MSLLYHFSRLICASQKCQLIRALVHSCLMYAEFITYHVGFKVWNGADDLPDPVSVIRVVYSPKKSCKGVFSRVLLQKTKSPKKLCHGCVFRCVLFRVKEVPELGGYGRRTSLKSSKLSILRRFCKMFLSELPLHPVPNHRPIMHHILRPGEESPELSCYEVVMLRLDFPLLKLCNTQSASGLWKSSPKERKKERKNRFRFWSCLAICLFRLFLALSKIMLQRHEIMRAKIIMRLIITMSLRRIMHVLSWEFSTIWA